MPYAFLENETIPAAIARLMDEQILRARDQLMDQKAPIEKRVHDARKRFKETRALLRMIREPLGAQFALENAWFRDAGRELAAARDAEAVLEALEKLPLPRGVRWRARRALNARKVQDHGLLEAKIGNVLEQLVVAQARVALWPTLADSFATLAKGLRRTYRDGRSAMHHSGMPEELHEWRKRVKEHWYHAQLLRHVWPSTMKAHAETLEELSRALGDHHDLFTLRQIVAASPAEFGRKATAIAILNTIDSRQRELEKTAAQLGERIYAETPSAWLERIRSYWSAWRS